MVKYGNRVKRVVDLIVDRVSSVSHLQTTYLLTSIRKEIIQHHTNLRHWFLVPTTVRQDVTETYTVNLKDSELKKSRFYLYYCM